MHKLGVGAFTVVKYSFEKLKRGETIKLQSSGSSDNLRTCTPRIPKMMKKVQQIKTMFPIGLREDRSVCTTNLRPGALLITRSGLNARTSLNTRRISKIFEVWPKIIEMMVSKSEMITSVPSIMFQPDLK